MLVRGASWSKSRLNWLVRKIYTEDKEHIVTQYWEYISTPDASLDEKIMQVVCAIPNGAAYSDEAIIAQLVSGPLCVNPLSSPWAKPNIAEKIYSAVGKDNVDKLMLDWGKKHKHCPLNNEAKWCLLVWLSECIDMVCAYLPYERQTPSNVLDKLISHVIRCVECGSADISLK